MLTAASSLIQHLIAELYHIQLYCHRLKHHTQHTSQGAERITSTSTNNSHQGQVEAQAQAQAQTLTHAHAQHAEEVESKAANHADDESQIATRIVQQQHERGFDARTMRVCASLEELIQQSNAYNVHISNTTDTEAGDRASDSAVDMSVALPLVSSPTLVAVLILDASMHVLCVNEAFAHILSSPVSASAPASYVGSHALESPLHARCIGEDSYTPQKETSVMSKVGPVMDHIMSEGSISLRLRLKIGN